VKGVPAGTRKVYVRYRFKGMGMDSVRLSTGVSCRREATRALEIIHQWDADGQRREFRERIGRPTLAHDYIVDTGAAQKTVNLAVILSCPPSGK
jgi:hypothetical protein